MEIRLGFAAIVLFAMLSSLLYSFMPYSEDIQEWSFVNVPIAALTTITNDDIPQKWIQLEGQDSIVVMVSNTNKLRIETRIIDDESESNLIPCHLSISLNDELVKVLKSKVQLSKSVRSEDYDISKIAGTEIKLGDGKNKVVISKESLEEPNCIVRLHSVSEMQIK